MEFINGSNMVIICVCIHRVFTFLQIPAASGCDNEYLYLHACQRLCELIFISNILQICVASDCANEELYLHALQIHVANDSEHNFWIQMLCKSALRAVTLMIIYFHFFAISICIKMIYRSAL